MSCNGGTQDKRVSAAAHIAYHKTKKQHHLHTLKCNSIGMRFSQAEWRKMPLCAATSLFSRFKVRVFFILEPSKGLFFLLFCSFFSSSLGEKQSFPFHSCFCLFSLMIVWVFFFFLTEFCFAHVLVVRCGTTMAIVRNYRLFPVKHLLNKKTKKKKQCAYREKRNNNRTSFFFRSHKTPSSVFCTPLKKKREKVLYSTESRRERRQLIKETHTERHVLNHHQQLKPENPEICDG